MVNNQYPQSVSKESSIGFIFTLLLLIILIILLLIGIYFLYQLIPGEPILSNPHILGPSKLEIEEVESGVPQFYPNMKFNHNNISYRIDEDCDEDKKTRMREAFYELSKNVNYISFYSVLDNPDIEVNCDENKEISSDENYFIAGEGGAKSIIQTPIYNVISEGVVLLYNSQESSIKCDWPIVELHELLHVFGFDHSENKKSLMYPYLNSCNQKLDFSIITTLNELYSKENLPDLYFKNAYGVKKGAYLDFNVNISNAGVINASEVYLGVFEGDKKIKEFDLTENGDIMFGAGISLEINNLKLNNRNSKNISLILDFDNLIKEYNEKNNIVVLSF